ASRGGTDAAARASDEDDLAGEQADGCEVVLICHVFSLDSPPLVRQAQAVPRSTPLWGADWNHGQDGTGCLSAHPARTTPPGGCGSDVGTSPADAGTAPRGGRRAGAHLDRVLRAARAGSRTAPLERGARRHRGRAATVGAGIR